MKKIDSQLHDGAEKGRLADVTRALAAGADVNSVTSFGKSALMKASAAGHVEIVALLIRLGGNIHLATLGGEEGRTAAMIEGFGDFDGFSQCNATALTLAASLDVARVLVEAGADVNWRNEDLQSCLMIAVECCDGPLVEYLIAVGAEVDFADRYGRTATCYAVDADDLDIAAILETAGGTYRERKDFEPS